MVIKKGKEKSFPFYLKPKKDLLTIPEDSGSFVFSLGGFLPASALAFLYSISFLTNQ
jgi:hypothetical protein